MSNFDCTKQMESQNWVEGGWNEKENGKQKKRKWRENAIVISMHGHGILMYKYARLKYTYLCILHCMAYVVPNEEHTQKKNIKQKANEI